VLDDKPRLQIQMVALNHFYNIELAPSEFKQLCLIKNFIKIDQLSEWFVKHLPLQNRNKTLYRKCRLEIKGMNQSTKEEIT
jgi:hypothetical protein